MIVTERKAKELLCSIDSASDSCAGSKCMAWRWCDKIDELSSGSIIDGVSVPDKQGYCGLAGVPNEIDQESKLDLLRLQVALQNEHHQKNVHDEINQVIKRMNIKGVMNTDDIDLTITEDLGIVPGARYRKGEMVYYISGEMIQEAIIEDITMISVNLEETIVYQINDKNFYEDQLHSSAAKLKAMMNVFSVDGRIK